MKDDELWLVKVQGVVCHGSWLSHSKNLWLYNHLIWHSDHLKWWSWRNTIWDFKVLVISVEIEKQNILSIDKSPTSYGISSNFLPKPCFILNHIRNKSDFWMNKLQDGKQTKEHWSLWVLKMSVLPPLVPFKLCNLRSYMICCDNQMYVIWIIISE